MESNKEKIFSIKKSELTEGVNFLNKRKIVAFVSNGTVVNAINNKCQHMSNSFSVDAENDKCVKCPFHGWRLDMESLNYENPEGLSHKKSLTVVDEGDEYSFIDENSNSTKFWNESRGRQELEEGEFGITYYSHACFKIKAGDKTFFADPWVYGPAFTKGWWLVHQPPKGWREDIAFSDGIYLSHNHSDHMNIFSLKEIVKLNPDIPLFIPNFEASDMALALKTLGFKNIHIPKFNTWCDLGTHSNFMILPDGSGRHDSGLLFEYKGHRIVTTVDCGNCCSSNLPKDVDLLLTSFAGGASGFPVCWEEQYDLVTINKYLTRNRKLMVERIVKELDDTGAKAYIPYAGFFTEAYHGDKRIKEINKKNSPDDIIKSLSTIRENTITHKPVPGDFFDLFLMKNTGETKEVFHNNETWEFSKFEAELEAKVLSNDEIVQYFRDLAFQDGLSLHVLECSDDFEEVYREFSVDFSNKECEVHFEKKVNSENNYLKMKVRQSTFSYVLREMLPWEELSIGFQCRFYREPDVYNFSFWNHVQNFVLRE